MKKVFVSKEKLKKLNYLLSLDKIDFEKEGVKEDSVLFEKVINFNKNIMVLIQVCTGQNNAYINSVLFKNGQEVTCLECEGEDSLDGEYIFDFNENEYVVKIEER